MEAREDSWILAHEYRHDAFGSGWTTVRRRGDIYRILFDGKDREVDLPCSPRPRPRHDPVRAADGGFRAPAVGALMYRPERTVGRLASVGHATRSRARPTTDYRDHHATIFVAPEVAGPIEAVRRSWDPSMAARIAAHVTVAYPQEAPIGDLLVERIRDASRNVRPFRLGLGGLACFEWPEGGVYVNVEDLDGGYRRLREEMLRPPCHGITYPARHAHARPSADVLPRS